MVISDGVRMGVCLLKAGINVRSISPNNVQVIWRHLIIFFSAVTAKESFMRLSLSMEAMDYYCVFY